MDVSNTKEGITTAGNVGFLGGRNIHHAWGSALVCLAAVLWATVGVANQMAAQSRPLDPAFIGLVRTAIGALTILCVGTLTQRHRTPTSCTGGTLMPLVFFGTCAALFQISLFRAFSEAGVTITVAVTVCLPPLIVACADAIREKVMPSVGLLGAIALALGGLSLLLSGNIQTTTSSTQLSAYAIMLLLTASFAFAGVAITSRTLGARLGPVKATWRGLALSTFILLLVVASGDQSNIPDIGSLDRSDIIFLAYIGVAATGIAYLAFVNGMVMSRSASIGVVASMIEPIVAALLAVILLNETLTTPQMLGCAIMLVSIIAPSLSGRSKKSSEA